MLDSFVKTYADRAYSHPTMVRHQGSVIAFAMDDRRRLVYAVLDATATAANDADRWPASPRALPFPRELAEVGLAIADQVQLPLVRKGSTEGLPAGTPIAASEIDDVLSTTARFTADAPFQVVSDDAYVYVFRQSIAAQDEPGLERYREGAKDASGNQVPLVDGTLLVDRFVLVGTDLQPTREVRYQRSRSKVRPQSSKDSLGATDLDKQPFVEPTQALSFISGLHSGGFAVVLVPTQVADVSRWQIFVEDSEAPLIDCYGIDRSADGLFDLAGMPAPDTVDAGGFAGGALSFTADGDHLEMHAPALGAAFTVETWLKVAPDAPDHELALLGSDDDGGDPAQSGLAAWISEGTRLRIGFGDGKAWHQSTTGDVLRPGTWNHVAISFDGSYLRVYVDGVLRHRDGALNGLVPAATGLTRIGAAKDTFRGLIDEVRLWRVARGASEIADSMSRRLTGLEPGLAVYWRLDDGYGDVVWDGGASKPRTDASVYGPAWVTSDAPIADTRSFTRTGVRVYPRIVTSGLSALLYYQQERGPSGYDTAVKKPLKKAARVMLAMATSDGENPGEIVVLDFGVGADGRLAQVPTELFLTKLDKADTPAASLDQQLARAAELQTEIAALEQSVSDGALAIRQLTLVNQIEQVPSSVYSFDLSELPSGLRASLLAYATQPARRDAILPEINAVSSQLVKAAAGLGAQPRLAELQAELGALETTLAGGVELKMPLVHLDPQGLTLAGAVLGFATTPATPLLFDSALGRVTLYFEGQDGQFLAAHYDTLTDRAKLTKPAGTGLVSFYARTANLADGALSLQVDAADSDDACTVTITMQAPGGTVTETWRDVPRDASALANVLNGGAATPVFAGAAAATAGTVSKVEVPGGTRISMAAGARLRVAGQVLRVSADADAGAKAIAVEPVLATIEDGASVFAIAYDYASGASSTQVPVNLATGSNIVAVNADGATGNVPPGPADFVGQSAVCRWYAPGPGGALSLDGVTGLVRPAAGGDQQGVETDGDFTLESWVKPAGTGGLGRVVASARDGGHSYTLALRPQPGALRFDGAHDAVIVPTSSALQFSGRITLEAWVQPQATDGVRDIVAHGYRNEPAGEVFLRINQGVYQVGSWDGSTHFAELRIPTEDLGKWVHLAGVWDGSAWRLYRNGTLAASAASAIGAVSVGAGWGIGATSSGTERFFAGGIDEVRIWNQARTADQIASGRGQRLTGSEPGLVGYWRPQLPEVFHYIDAPGAPATVKGAPRPVPGPFSSFTAVLGVDGQVVESADKLPADRWSHLAAVFHQGYGVRLAGAGAYLDAGSSETLDLIGDLTIEAGVQLDDLNAPQALVGRGTAGGEAAGMPYSLAVGTDGKLVFSFIDSAGVPHVVPSTGTIGAGAFHRVAVTRKRTTLVDPPPPGATTVDPAKVVDTFQDIAFFIDGRPAGGARYTGADAGTSGASTLIGQALIGDQAGSPPASLRGALSEVRIWSLARPVANVGMDITGGETGLVAWWKFAENAGSAAADSKSTNTATLHGAVTWIKSPDPAGSQILLYRDGAPLKLGTPQGALTAVQPQFTIGGLIGGQQPADLFRGELTELRIWRMARTAQEIQDNLFSRLTSGLEDLLAYYRFDLSSDRSVNDSGLRGHHLVATPGCAPVVSAAPLGDDIPQVRDAMVGVPTPFNDTLASTPAVAEYAELETDANGNLGGAFKRCYGMTRDGRWQIVSGYKVGDVRAEWVGQAQFDPQLIGFIEGAPPVPSENLTVEDDYADASSVALTEADSTTYTYASSRESGFDMSVETSFGVGPAADVSVGFGVIEKLVSEKTSIGVKATFENSLGWLDSAQNGVGNTLTRVSSLGLRGSKEDAPKYEVGARYVPDNTGFALVQSETADVFALRLVHTGALISYQMRANPDIPKDWNIITFPIDPRYTKQGTLDGKIGLQAERDDYPHALTYSSDQSYFKPIEAYALKNRIVQEEQRLRARYDQFDAGAAGRKQGDGTLPRLFKRNLVNTYVWTAAGGQFAEEEQTLDTISETTGGSYSFKGLAGIVGQLSLEAGPVALDFELSALFGGHLNLEVTKAKDSQTSFGVQSAATPESRITQPDSHGRPVRQPGKVDAYRYMTFYLEPAADHHDAFYGQVIDPIWLQQSGDPNATALRQAQQAGKRPPCWRVLHRVTYVSRVLPVLSARPGDEPTLEQTLQKLDVDSSYELIRVLGPFVRDKTARYADFQEAVSSAVRTYLPQLQPHIDDVVEFLVLYYGVTDSAQLTPPPEDLSRLAPTPPAVFAGAPQTVSLAKGVWLEGSALDEKVAAAALTVGWTKVDGPGEVTFAAPAAVATEATFSAPGVYVLRLTADNGQLTAHADTTVTVTAAPVEAMAVA